MIFYNKENARYKLLIYLGWVALLIFICFVNKEPFYLIFGIFPAYFFFKRYMQLKKRLPVLELESNTIEFFDKSLQLIIINENSNILFEFLDVKNKSVENELIITYDNRKITSFLIEKNEIYRLINFIKENQLRIKILDKRAYSHQIIKSNLSQDLAVQAISAVVCIGFAIFLFFKYEALFQPEPIISTLKGGIVRSTLKTLHELGGKAMVLSILAYIGFTSLLKTIYLKKNFGSI